MYVRCAYFEGTVAEADRPAFDAGIREGVLPAMARFADVRHVQALFGREYDEGAPQYYLVLRHGYDSPEAMGVALDSDNREAVWAELEKIMPLFQGKVFHVNYETTTMNP